MRDRKFLRATTRVAPTFQVEQAKHVGATLVVALPADCIPHVPKSHAHPSKSQGAKKRTKLCYTGQQQNYPENRGRLIYISEQSALWLPKTLTNVRLL